MAGCQGLLGAAAGGLAPSAPRAPIAASRPPPAAHLVSHGCGCYNQSTTRLERGLHGHQRRLQAPAHAASEAKCSVFRAQWQQGPRFRILRLNYCFWVSSQSRQRAAGPPAPPPDFPHRARSPHFGPHMPRPEQRLYSELLRIGRRFQAERLPLLGVAGSPLVAADLQWGATLRAAVEAPPVPGAGLAGAFVAAYACAHVQQRGHMCTRAAWVPAAVLAVACHRCPSPTSTHYRRCCGRPPSGACRGRMAAHPAEPPAGHTASGGGTHAGGAGEGRANGLRRSGRFCCPPARVLPAPQLSHAAGASASRCRLFFSFRLMTALLIIWMLVRLNHVVCSSLLQGLAEWAGLVERYGGGWGTHRRHSSSGGSSSSISAATSSGDGDGDGMPPGLPFAAAAAVEEGLALLSRQAQELADPLSFLEQEAGSGGSSSSSGCDDGQAPVTLDQLAAVVRRQHPRLFPLSPGATSSSSGGVDRPSGGGSSGEAQLAQAEALAGVLYRQHRFRFEPFEWVYEGLEPLLLPPSGALHRRKLAPLTLAAAAAGAGRRLGLPLLPVPAEPGEVIAAAVAEGPAGGAAAGGLPLDQLRPEVAQRYAGRAGAAPPTAGPWVLLLGGGDSAAAAAAGGQQEQWAHALDASTGRLMDAAELRQRHPQLQLVSWQGGGRWLWDRGAAEGCTLPAPLLPGEEEHATGHAAAPTGCCCHAWPLTACPDLLCCFCPWQAVDWHRRAPLVAWQHMIRTVIQVCGCGCVHARRGWLAGKPYNQCPVSALRPCLPPYLGSCVQSPQRVGKPGSNVLPTRRSSLAHQRPFLPTPLPSRRRTSGAARATWWLTGCTCCWRWTPRPRSGTTCWPPARYTPNALLHAICIMQLHAICLMQLHA